MFNTVKVCSELLSVMTNILMKEHVFAREKKEMKDVVRVDLFKKKQPTYTIFYSKQTRLYMEEGVARDSDHRHHHSSVQHCQPTCLLEFDQGFPCRRTHLAAQYIMRSTRD